MFRTSLIAAALAAASGLALAQEAIPANDWTNSAVSAARAKNDTAAAASVTARVEITASRTPAAFQDRPGERGSAHVASLSGVSRAEVLADLASYRASGLASLEAGEAPDFNSRAHDQAQARYTQQRASQQFAQL